MTTIKFRPHSGEVNIERVTSNNLVIIMHELI